MRPLALFGDSVTTDHISPAGRFQSEHLPPANIFSPLELKKTDFNSYGSRRGNHEVMMRGTFANVRIRIKWPKEKKAALPSLMPEGTLMSIYRRLPKICGDKCSSDPFCR